MNVAVIHTSDRILFKTCRRKWDFISPLRQNLEPKETFSAAAWYGSGFHFALEDFHSYNRFGNPLKAFDAYYKCFDRETELDMNCDGLSMMAPSMFDHYVNNWLPYKMKMETLWLDSGPQVEVEVLLELKEISKLLDRKVYYSMRFDRVVLDDIGRLWVMDYKTAASFNTGKLETDPQISAYSWGAELYYNAPVEGMAYLQFKKSIIKEPRILKKPMGAISADATQNTTYGLYYDALMKTYGRIDESPKDNLDCLNVLLNQESEYGDAFIRLDMVRRNAFSKKKEYSLIKLEALDMLNPNVRIYPNPVQDCAKFCQFRPVCIAIDDGADYEFILKENYCKRKGGHDIWKKKLVYPS